MGRAMALVVPVEWWPWVLLAAGILLFLVYVLPRLHDWASPYLARRRHRRQGDATLPCVWCGAPNPVGATRCARCGKPL